jgi:hypothetical protein
MVHVVAIKATMLDIMCNGYETRFRVVVKG